MKNELWEAFLLSGSVCDYLAYAGLRNEVSQNSEQKNNGTGDSTKKLP